jgi:uncharacterized membrane protein YjgN (DUF898 family)
MKTYFNFTLTGKMFLPIWLAFYFLVIIPYVIYYNLLAKSAQSGNQSPLLALMFLCIIIASILISFFVLKITIENIWYNNSQINFSGRFTIFTLKVLLGILLTIVTMTIYMAWFIKDIFRFIINNSSIQDSKFRFRGKGGALFLILLLSIYAPIIIFVALFGKHLLSIDQTINYIIILQIITGFIMIPYLYLFYKWMINIEYKNYHIKWNTEFFDSCGKILVEILLCIITVGIYMPLAYLKLFKYFAERTVAEKNSSSLKFGYDLDSKNDFIFIWGQLLLTVITIGIYYPWAYSNIGKRIISKTYSLRPNAA